MNKAYDRVEWSFLDAAMRRMGFAQKWRDLIMQCLKSVKFCILINGQQMDRFQPSRGIRQEDPLSPYLFIICVEALSTLLYQAENSGWLTGVPSSPKGPRLHHLFFANDSLLFCRATSRDWGQLSQLVEHYVNNSIKKKLLFFLAATQAKRPATAFSSYQVFLIRRDVTNIWVYLPLWVNLG